MRLVYLYQVLGDRKTDYSSKGRKTIREETINRSRRLREVNLKSFYDQDSNSFYNSCL